MRAPAQYPTGIGMQARILDIARHAITSVWGWTSAQAAVGGFQFVVKTETEEIRESRVRWNSKFPCDFQQCRSVIDKMSNMYYIGLNVAENLRQNRPHVRLII